MLFLKLLYQFLWLLSPHHSIYFSSHLKIVNSSPEPLGRSVYLHVWSTQQTRHRSCPFCSTTHQQHQHEVRKKKEKNSTHAVRFLKMIHFKLLRSPVTANCHVPSIHIPIMNLERLQKKSVCVWGENLCVHSNFLSLFCATLSCCHGDVVTHVC